MRHNVYEFKKKDNDDQEKRLHAKNFIEIDQPFDYEEVAAITGPEYIRNLQRDGMSFIAYEELKSNVAGFLVKDVKKPTYALVSGFQVAEDYYYHKGHSWARVEDDGKIRVGIDDFTSRVFGPLNSISLPHVGSVLKRGDVGWVLTRNGRKAPMQSPVSGVVHALNDRIKENLDITHNDPYEAGWLFLLVPSSPESNLKELYWGKECFQWMEKESRGLMQLLGPEYERLAATGGRMIDDIFGRLPEINWDRLVSRFLHTAEKS